MKKTAYNLPEETLETLDGFLQQIDPDVGYAEWITVLMVVFNETGGSDEGLALADLWSSHGQKYKGFADVEYRWNRFDPHAKRRVGIPTLTRLIAARKIY